MNKALLVFGLLFGIVLSAAAQSNVKKNIKPGNSSPAVSETPQPDRSEKKNGRVEHVVAPAVNKSFHPTYTYQFTRPGFTYAKVVIRHDVKGAGDIVFEKDGFAETITDPIQLSEVTVAKLKRIFADLNFIDSTENYQYERDYSHLGDVEISVTANGRTRTAKFNWTSNKLAKELADEYRRIGNEYTWMFEMNLALENQPLQSPGLVDLFAGYVERQEISDPAHLLPILRKLASDERMPLMGRNRAAKLVEKLSKLGK